MEFLLGYILSSLFFFLFPVMSPSGAQRLVPVVLGNPVVIPARPVFRHSPPIVIHPVPSMRPGPHQIHAVPTIQMQQVPVVQMRPAVFRHSPPIVMQHVPLMRPGPSHRPCVPFNPSIQTQRVPIQHLTSPPRAASMHSQSSSRSGQSQGVPVVESPREVVLSAPVVESPEERQCVNEEAVLSPEEVVLSSEEVVVSAPVLETREEAVLPPSTPPPNSKSK